MKVDVSFLNGKSELQILEFFLDENGRETAGEQMIVNYDNVKFIIN